MGTELAQSIKKTENGQPEAATEGRTGTRQTGTGATGWKTEVKAELKAHRGRLIVCALIGILLLAFLISHKNVFEEPWGTNINLAADYGTIPLQEGHELSQSFQSEGQHLDQLFLWIEGAASADGTLLVRLDDENGTLVTQSVAMADYAEDVAKVWVPMDQDLKKGKSYTVTLNYERTAANGGSHVQADAASAGDPGEAQGVIYFRSSGSAALEMPAVGDGGTLEDGITVVFDYERMNIRAFARAIFLVLVLVGLLAVPASFIQGILRKIGVGGHGACGTLTEPFLVEENRQKLSMLASAAVLFLGPVFTYWLVEYAGGNWENVSKSYGFYNIIWYFLFYAAIYVVTDRAAWAAAIVNLVFLALAAANYFVLQFRGKPVLPWELKAAKTAATVAGGYDLQWTQQLLTGVLAAAVFIVLAFRLCSSAHRRQLSATTGQAFRFRIFKDALLVLIGFGFVMIFYESGFQARRGIGTDQWDISGNYANQGFLLSSMSYLGLKNVQAPDGYSQKSVQRIRDSIDQSTASMDGTSTVKTVPQNIIMIMNESLTDYSVFNNFAPSEDVLTFIHSLQENTIKGYLQTPVFGGGTCNTEYESLTGNSLTFLPGGVMPYQMYVTPDTISLNKILQGQGYTGYAMHPFPASNWNREEVFQDMGFAQFLSEPDFAGEEMIRDMCSDAGDYDRMIKLYEEKKGSPLFFFNVTLQNHGGYTDGEYEATIHVPTSGRPAGGAYPQAEQYLSLAHASDQAFEQLVNYFSQVEEPTMIVMYGDHQPKLEDGFYEYLTGKPASEWTQEETMQLYETPYVIWTNYPLDTTTQVPKRLSANYLSSWMLKLAGVQLPEYNRYLLQLCRDVPVVTPKGCLDARGNYFRAEDAGRYAPLLQEYAYLQYNNLFDADHRLQSFWGEETP